ncbi:MAG: fibronectin type III domain-containing protein [Planctomycetota bacterium]
MSHGAGRQLHAEALEPRLVLSAGAAQPDGGLDGKIVYLHGGHGYTANNLGSGSWASQRPLLLEMVEDLGNQDQMTFLADYLWNAGATVAALRPIGHQPNEVVMDNDDPGVTFSGAWSNSSSPIYFGSPGDVPYRFASTSLTETATARYTPNIPESGFYPVYSWTRYGSDRATDHLYKVGHSGGVTEVTVNHRRVGNGTVYLGTFYFEQGTSGYVEISNRSAQAGNVVIADMIRFGNGVGDIDRGGGVSGFDREDESGIYWVQWHVDRSQGVPNTEYRFLADDRDASISFSPRYAEYMNREADGEPEDRVFISFHSNAGGGRGVLGLHNTNNGGATPNQFLLAQTIAEEVNDDLVAQNGLFEHNWFNRGNNLTFQASFNYGEINNSSIRGEFDATIIETGFHDNQLDAELLRDPKVRDAIAEATYQGIVDYFRAVDNTTTPVTRLPDPVTGVRAQPMNAGEVLVEWEPPVGTSYGGSAPTSYTVFTSTNGYGFDAGQTVSSLANSLLLTGLDPSETYYIRVAANNAGGRSMPSEVVAAAASGGGDRVLIVNGFDRLGRTQNPEQTFVFGGQLERVRPRQSNSFDYAVQMAEAISAAAPGTSIATAANEAIEASDYSLGDFDSVFWILGEESSADQTFSAAEQAAVTSYLNGGGKLFVSGSEIGWDLDFLGNGQSFYNNQLRADFVSDDANTYSVRGVSGSIFEGLSFSFDNGSQFYNTEFPDVITAGGGATLALSYPRIGGAGLTYADADGEERLVMLAFPFETITSEATRTELMQRVVEFFDTTPPPSADFNRDGIVNAADFTVWRDNLGQSVAPGEDGDANFDGVVDVSDHVIFREQFGGPPPGLQQASQASIAAPVATQPDAIPAVSAEAVAAVFSSASTAGGSGGSVSSASTPMADPEKREWDLLLSALDQAVPAASAAGGPGLIEAQPASEDAAAIDEFFATEPELSSVSDDRLGAYTLGEERQP